MRHPTKSELYHLFQARMWREYAMAWDGRKTSSGVSRNWVENILKISRTDCIKNAKTHLLNLAKNKKEHF